MAGPLPSTPDPLPGIPQLSRPLFMMMLLPVGLSKYARTAIWGESRPLVAPAYDATSSTWFPLGVKKSSSGAWLTDADALAPNKAKLTVARSPATKLKVIQ